MRRTFTHVCLACALALSFCSTAGAQTTEELQAQLKVLQAQLDALKKGESSSSHTQSDCAAQAFQATANERYRFTYIGRLVVPTSAIGNRTGQVANALSGNVLNLSGATLRANSSSFSSRTGNTMQLNLNALSPAVGNNVTLSVPLASVLSNSGNLANADGSGLAVLSVNRSTLRNGARRLSAIERASRGNHQIVTDANFVSGIYRGTDFTAAPSATNPYVGRYVQSDGQLNTVMAVGQQFIVTP